MVRKLHIGGECAAEGWEVLNAVAAPYVDHECSATDLSRFADNTFSEIYASHIVEHFDFREEIFSVLREWRRVLAPGGKIYISVPDLDVLARMFLAKDEFNLKDRYLIMRMIFGAHCNKYDYHLVGLNWEILSTILLQTGYTKIRKVREFGLFPDTSVLRLKGELISLNVIAEKPAVPEAEFRGGVRETRRNDPCPCGSGQRYKHCHGRPAGD